MGVGLVRHTLDQSSGSDEDTPLKQLAVIKLLPNAANKKRHSLITLTDIVTQGFVTDLTKGLANEYGRLSSGFSCPLENIGQSCSREQGKLISRTWLWPFRVRLTLMQDCVYPSSQPGVIVHLHVGKDPSLQHCQPQPAAEGNSESNAIDLNLPAPPPHDSSKGWNTIESEMVEHALHGQDQASYSGGEEDHNNNQRCNDHYASNKVQGKANSENKSK